VEPSLFIEAIVTLGLTSALVVFFVWISWKREERLSARVTELEHQLTTTVVEALRDNTRAMFELVDGMRDLHNKVHLVAGNLDERPCAMTGKKILKHLGIDDEPGA